MRIINIKSPISYARCLQALDGGRDKDRRPLGRHGKLYLHRRSDHCVVRLYGTDILRIDEDNTLTVRTGGWHTPLTLSVIDDLANIYIRSIHSCPFDNKIRLWRRGGNARWGLPFSDGMQFRKGELLNRETIFDEKTRPTLEAVRAWTRAIRWLNAQALPRIAIGEFDGDFTTPCNWSVEAILHARTLPSAELQALLVGLVAGFPSDRCTFPPLVRYQREILRARQLYLHRADKQVEKITYFEGAQS